MQYSFWQPSYSNELYHYGVIGMKWGVRKARKQQSIADGFDKKKEDSLRRAGFTEVEISKARKKANTVFDKKGVSLDYRKKEAGEKAEAIRLNVNRKASSKLEKLNARYEKKQAKADRQFEKAERKASSILASKRSADRAFRKASKSQFKANKAAAKGKRWYEQMQRSYKKAGIPMSERNREIGEEFIRQVRANSRAMYAASYAAGR